MSLSLSPGTVIAGRYRLDRLLGKGGMGQVWAATHEVTLRAVALKLLNTPVHLRPDRRRRFFREARAASAVRHPNVVQIHDFFELDDDTPVMVMDLLEGETLGQRLAREHSLGLNDAVNIFLPVVSAVGTAHALGIVHRDLKPDNVFLARSEKDRLDVRVLDFGIAKLTGLTGVDAEDVALTGTGAMLGTPSYMSPEQSFGDKDVDHRTDIWSLGVMLYETLAGTKPVDGETVGRVLHRLTTEAITPIEVVAPELPAEVSALIGRMLTRDPGGRPKDLREVHVVLSRYAEVEVQGFDAATEERPMALDSNPSNAAPSSRAVIPLSDACDPDAATFAGGPPSPSSPGVAVETRAEPGETTGSSAKPWVLLIGAMALLAIGSFATWLVLSAHNDASDRSGAADRGSTTQGETRSVTATALSEAPVVNDEKASASTTTAEPTVQRAPAPASAPRVAPTRPQRPRPETSAAPASSAVPSPSKPGVPRDPTEAVVDQPPF